MKKTCKNCFYAKWQLTEKGNIRHSVYGRCQYQIEMPKLPKSVGRHYAPKNTNGIWRNDKLEDCECWEPKII